MAATHRHIICLWRNLRLLSISKTLIVDTQYLPHHLALQCYVVSPQLLDVWLISEQIIHLSLVLLQKDAEHWNRDQTVSESREHYRYVHINKTSQKVVLKICFNMSENSEIHIFCSFFQYMVDGQTGVLGCRVSVRMLMNKGGLGNVQTQSQLEN